MILQTSKRSISAAAVLLGASCLVPTCARPTDRNILWNIVHTQCVPGKIGSNDPRPCAVVNLDKGVDRGYVLLRDTEGGAQYLLIPTSKITGIESTKILRHDATNYFSQAWRWRPLFETRLHQRMSRENIGLAINSFSARTQDQLHIHIDCIRLDVRRTLRRHRERIGRKWTPLKETLAGHHYVGMRVLGTNLVVNPFKLLASSKMVTGDKIKDYSLVIVGETFAHHRDGFLILAGHADAAVGDRGSGEELQDHSCAVAKEGRTERVHGRGVWRSLPGRLSNSG
jgi:CDP-diacylglycerol pyrophosphatase